MSGWLDLLTDHRVIAVIRSDCPKVARQMALAVARGGIRLIEITWNTRESHALIPSLKQELPDCCIGTGTILDCPMAGRAIDCGASFLFMPHTDKDVIAFGRSRGVPVIPGAMTPTEIMGAWRAGAETVKVFPVHSLGGVAYLCSLTSVLPHIPLIPTGGVTLDNAGAFLQAGAIGVGLARDLFAQAGGDANLWVQRTELLLQKIRLS